MKRLLLSSVLATTMLLSTASLVLAAENTETTTTTATALETKTLSTENVFGDYYFYDGVITGYRGAGGDIVIPETINGQEVLKIDSGVFGGKNLTSVVFPDTLLQIDSYAFQNNKELITITLPASIQSVGYRSFYNTNLTVVNFKGDEYAWKDLNLGLPGTVRYGYEAPKITSANGTTPPAVPAAAPLSDFYFYDGVITGYRGNGGDLVIPAVIDGQEVIKIDSSAFAGKNITSIVCPDTLLIIDSYAFQNNSSLVSITLPASIQSIGYRAFYNTNLDILNFKGDEYAYKEKNLSSLASLYRLSYQEPLVTSSNQTVAVTPGQVSNVNDFISTEGIITEYRGDGGNIVIPSTHNGQTIWKIDSSAFAGKNITSVVLPDNLTEISSYAFQNNSAMVSITIPSSLTSIGYRAFYNTNLDIVNYKGDEYQWNALGNTTLTSLVRLNVGTSLAPTVPITERNGSTTPTTPEVTTPTTPSTDIVYSGWAESFVTNAQQNNLLTDALGKDYTADITRLQIADLLVNMVEKYSGTVLPEADAGTFSDTASSSILKANAAGLISGKGNGLFAPYDTATRQEISIMMYNAIKKMEELSSKSLINHSLNTVSGFNDFDSAATWAQNSLAILVNAGIMTGSGGNLDPLSTTSIQQALVMNQNIFGLGK